MITLMLLKGMLCRLGMMKKTHKALADLGYAFRFVFRFLPGLIFWNPRNSAEHTSKLNHSRARLIWSGILAGILEGSATCNEHSLRDTQKTGVTMAFCCVSCCCYRDPPQAAMPRCRNCFHCLIRGSSGGAGMAACGGGSSISSSGGSSHPLLC